MHSRIERVAAAIANRRAGRRGSPEVTNVLDILKSFSGGKLYLEVMDDARAAIEAMREPTDAMAFAGANALAMEMQAPSPTLMAVGFVAMIDEALKEPT
jgi:hypothetical protein